MSRFGYSRQELFMTLPRLAQFDPEAAERILHELRDEVAGQPFEELRQLRDEASFRDQTGNQAEAIRLSEQVVARCRAGQGSAADVRWELASLVTRRLATDEPAQHELADREIAELSTGPADSSLATALLARATARLRLAGLAPATDQPLTDTQRAAALESWQDLERAEACRLSADEQSTPLLARVALCRVLGRDDEGLGASAAAIDHFRARLPATTLSPTQWSDRLVSLQSLYGYRVAVLLRARPPRVREAFECADLGRAQTIRQQLAWTTGEASPAEDIAPPAYPELVALLARERAALVMFDVGARSSGAFVVDPAEPEAMRFPLELTRSELAKLLPAKQEAPSARKRLFGALPVLSEALGAPLRSVAERYDLIYLSPSSELATVPFAALTLDGNGFVAERCATAYAPSTSILRWCIARRRRLPVRQFLAFGAGGTKDENGAEISFAAQAHAISDRVARVPGINSRLLPEGTTPDQLLDAALTASILHLECHGYLDSTVSSVLSSYLVFAEKPEVQLHAQQVADRRGQIPAELVFLDACLSGTFTAAMKNEVGGFWQAFLVAGAATLVATLTPVDPRRATELVTDFYDHWLGDGLGRAQALRAAQRAMLSAGRGPEDWATHILIGDAG
jgi:CHAT domain-containing protein